MTQAELKVEELSLSGVKKITPVVFSDSRGFFLQTYSQSLYAQVGITDSFVQGNHSYSKRGTLRGMHFQRHPGQAKLVSVAVGEIFDVVVDLRPSSLTFKRWEGVYLDGKKCQQLFIPLGFAHGFCVVSEEAHVLYQVSAPYDPLEERGFRFDDKEVQIAWPIREPLLSERDRKAPFLKEVLA